LNTFQDYLRKAAAGLEKVFRREGGLDPRLQQLERDLLALTIENQTLAGKLEKLAAESERHRTEALQRFEVLERARRDTETACGADAGRLRELERHLTETGEQRAQERAQIAALEAFIDDTKTRLETRDNQLKFLQDSAREQLQALKTSLAEAASRLETRDNELSHLQDTTREQIVVLENSLGGAARRFETLDGEMNELRSRLGEQTRQFEAVLSSTNVLFESMNNQIEALEKKLELEHQLQQNLFRDTQTQLRRQDSRMKRALAAAAGLLLVLATAIILLFRLAR
jgi:chromosome segregation ATPase